MTKKEVFDQICKAVKTDVAFFKNQLFGASATLEIYVSNYAHVPSERASEALKLDPKMHKMFEEAYNSHLKTLNKLIELGDYVREKTEK